MAKEKITVGIDLGTSTIKVAVVQFEQTNSKENKRIPHILGTGIAPTKGIRRGAIEDITELNVSLATAIALAEKSSGIKIKQAEVSVGDAGLKSFTASGDTIVSRADLEITDLDYNKASESSESSLAPTLTINKRIIHRIPIGARVDGHIIFDGKPIGMKGSKLEVRNLFVAVLLPHLSRIARVVENNDVEIIDVVVNPLASSMACLSKSQKIAGCVLINIGAETTSMIVYEENLPVSLEIFPLGGQDITNDIALGLKISIEEAESIKIGAMTPSTVSRKKLDEIIEARLDDIFELVEAHLKKIGRSQLLPAGVFLTGGGSKILGIEVMAKNFLKLPTKVVSIPSGVPGKNIESIWSVAYGLCLLGISNEENAGGEPSNIKETIKKVFTWLKQFLP